MQRGIKTLNHGYELLTLYRGLDVTDAAAQGVRELLAKDLGKIEIEIVDGGQPHYDFLIAAE